MSIRQGGLVVILALLAGCASLQNTHFEGTAVLPAQSAPDFTLTDQHSMPWTLSQQHGTVTAVFFGYTHCTDTCPLTLGKIARAIASQGSKSADAQIAFITIDPERDTPPVLGAYVKRFPGAKIVGLTGTAQHVAAIENAYHVWSQKIPGKRGNDDYDDAHSAEIFLIDRDGNERVIHNPTDSTTSIATDLRTLLQ